MSSLSATQADGYYIPPSYVDSGQYKKKSVQQFNHPNHKGHNQYLTRNVVRFELPYDGFCLNPQCQAHVGRGTRFNAHKTHVDNYHTSKIYEFQMKCRACASKEYTFVIRTNPKEKRFDYIRGIKLKMEEFDTVKAESLGVIDTDYGHAIHNFSNGAVDASGGSSATNISAIDQLEKKIAGKRRAMTERDAMGHLMKLNHSIMYDDASSNAKLRAGYRVKRKAKKRRLGDAALKGLGKGIELGDRDEFFKEDTAVSRAAFGQKEVKDAKSKGRERMKFKSIRTSGIFHTNNNCASLNISSEVSESGKVTRPPEVRPIQVKSEGDKTCKEKKRIDVSIQEGKLSTRRYHTRQSVVKEEPSDEDTTNLEPKVDSALLALADYGSDSD